MVLTCQYSVRSGVRCVRGPDFLAPQRPADPDSDTALALRGGALLVPVGRPPCGKPREASGRALRDAAADTHDHIDRGRRNLGGRTAWRPQSDSDARYAARRHHDHHERHGGGHAADRRRQASRADVQSAGRQRFSQRPPASRDLRPHHAGLHADDSGPDLFGRAAIRPGDFIARPLPALSRSADRAVSRLFRGRGPYGHGGGGGRGAHLVLDCDAGRLHGGSRLSRRAIRAADRLSA